MTIEVRRATDRFVTRADGRTTYHSFSFGSHYDPGNVGFGALVAHNDEELPPGTGYPDHPHVDTEIVTVVLDGALRHTDSEGRSGVLVPGEISRTSAGAGLVHSEVTEPGVRTRFVQTWLRPDEPGGPPSYAASGIGRPAGLTEVVGPDGVLGVGTRGARLYLGDVRPGDVVLPDAPLLHLFSAGARLSVGDRELFPDDVARRVDAGGRPRVVSPPRRGRVWALTR